jgi:hypothetical protein
MFIYKRHRIIVDNYAKLIATYLNITNYTVKPLTSNGCAFILSYNDETRYISLTSSINELFVYKFLEYYKIGAKINFININPIGTFIYSDPVTISPIIQVSQVLKSQPTIKYICDLFDLDYNLTMGVDTDGTIYVLKFSIKPSNISTYDRRSELRFYNSKNNDITVCITKAMFELEQYIQTLSYGIVSAYINNIEKKLSM